MSIVFTSQLIDELEFYDRIELDETGWFPFIITGRPDRTPFSSRAKYLAELCITSSIPPRRFVLDLFARFPFIQRDRRESYRSLRSLASAGVENLSRNHSRNTWVCALPSLAEVSARVISDPRQLEQFWKHVVGHMPPVESSVLWKGSEEEQIRAVQSYMEIPESCRPRFVALLAAGSSLENAWDLCRKRCSTRKLLRTVRVLTPVVPHKEKTDLRLRKPLGRLQNEFEECRQYWRLYQSLCREYPILRDCPVLSAYLVIHCRLYVDGRATIQEFIDDLWKCSRILNCAKLNGSWTNKMLNDACERPTLKWVVALAQLLSRNEMWHVRLRTYALRSGLAGGFLSKRGTRPAQPDSDSVELTPETLEKVLCYEHRKL